jgi:hypothetical protein
VRDLIKILVFKFPVVCIIGTLREHTEISHLWFVCGPE